MLMLPLWKKLPALRLRKRRAAGHLAALVLAAALLTAPAGHAYSMSTLKSWVNTVRPGTFPDLETGEGEAQQEPEEPVAEEAPLTDTERDILLSLQERKRKLDERDMMLNQREEQLRVLRDNIQQQVAELKRLQQDIEASMEAKRAQDAENMERVVELYNGMDPRAGAEKFQSLEPQVAAQILMGMNRRRAAALLEELPPETAKQVTERIVSRTPGRAVPN